MNGAHPGEAAGPHEDTHIADSHAAPAATSLPPPQAALPALGARLEPYHAAIILASGFLIRAALIHAYPPIFGGDSILRLVNHDKILLSHQLPVLQAAIHLLGLLSEDPLLVRYFMAAAGSVAGWGFYLLASTLLGRTTAFCAALLFVSHPFVLAYSIVPYQEILMLAGLFFAFYFFFSEQWLSASIALGVACLTRYEAWVAVPVFTLAFAMRGSRRAVDVAKGSLLFGWGPLGWLLFNAGIAPGGSFVIDLNVPLERLHRYVYLAWISIKFTSPPVLLLAVAGSWRFAAQGLWRSRRYIMLVAFVAMFLVAILLSAHGDREQPDRFVGAREAHILFSALTLLAGLGLSRVTQFRLPLLVAFCLAWSLVSTQRFVASEVSEPRLQLSYKLAFYLDQHVQEGERIVVLAKPVPADLIEDFLDKATLSGGAAGRQRALHNLLQLDVSPHDYQRTLVHSRLGKDQLQSLSTLPLPARDQASLGGTEGSSGSRPSGSLPPEWIVVWNDFRPANPAEAELQRKIAGKDPVEVLRHRNHAARIYRE